VADTDIQRFHLDIEAHSPLAFPQSKPGTQFQASLGYVPGAVLYGALGACLKQHNAFDLDLMEQIRCHNAYPLYPHPIPKGYPTDLSVAPLPATALQPKGDDFAPFVDALVRRVCWERQQPAGLVYAPVDEAGRPLDAPKGFYAYDSAGGCIKKGNTDALVKPQATQRALTRVAINRRRGTAEDQRLYSPLVINEATRTKDEEKQGPFVPTRFVGSLVVPAEHRAAIRSALDAVDRLGGRQTTGLGAVQIAATAHDQEDASAIQERIITLTRLFQEQARRYDRMGGDAWDIAEASIFTVNLVADALLFEEGWLPTQQISAAMLAEAASIDATLLRAFTSTRTAGGWNVSWKRPKPTALATAMGSVFVFQARSSLTLEDCARLARLQGAGIGERRAEGYGQVRICDAFHLWAAAEEAARDTKEAAE
jgi:CRISPR-associated protein Csx10